MKELLCFGDSNTWGLIPGSQPARQFAPALRWTGRLQAQCPGLRVTEAGLCGRTTVFEDPQRPGRNGLQALAALLAQTPPDAAILMLGTNDCKPVYHADPPAVAAGISRCLSLLTQAVAPEAVLLIAPAPLGADVWRPEKDPAFDRDAVTRSRALGPLYAAAAAAHGTAFLDAGAVVTVSPADDEHLDAAGHRRLADAIFEQLKTMHLV